VSGPEASPRPSERFGLPPVPAWAAVSDQG